ncbi:hypothetical protein ACP4OV_022283 [Aristida adscensionis]
MWYGKKSGVTALARGNFPAASDGRNRVIDLCAVESPSLPPCRRGAAFFPAAFVHRHSAMYRGEGEITRSVGMEERRWMDVARMVPATLLLVGTSDKVFASIKCARKLLAGDRWGYDDTDDPDSPSPTPSPSSSAGGGGDRSVGATGAGDRGAGVPVDSSGGGDHRGGLPNPVNTADGREREATPGRKVLLEVALDDASRPVDDLADLLAGELTPGGHLSAAYREITRLVSLHREAGHVFVLCAARLGGRQVQPDDPPWQRWRDLREAVGRHAHDALLRLSSAASAAAASEDFLRWRSTDSPRRKEWRMAAKQLVRDARRSLGEAKDSVRLMREAVMCEFFETWMILNRE